ncbi:MAG: MMPL family transporter [Pseudomonadales bacterium]|nr:MMPL family transporter [Pseudomonadales bacterium]
MDNKLLALSRFFARIPVLVLKARWLVLAALLLSTAFMTYGAFTRTTMDMTVDSFIDQHDPAIAALHEFRKQFGSDDSVFLVYRARDNDVFSARSLAAVRELTSDLQRPQRLDPARLPQELHGSAVELGELDKIRRVQSLTTVRVQHSDADTLRSDRLVPEPLPTDTTALAAIRQEAMDEDDYRLLFYSADGRYAGIMIQTVFGAEPEDGFTPLLDDVGISLDSSFSAFDDPASFSLDFDESVEVEDIPFQTVDMFDYSRFFTALKAVYGQYDEALEFFPVGNPPMMEFVYRTLQQMMWLAVAMIAIFVGLLWILFRSFSAVLWPILTIALSLAWTWGATAWLGASLSTMISLTCLLVFAVGIADCVHVMSAYFGLRKEGSDHDDALVRAYEKTGLAIFITSITTMAGVLALSYSDLVPIRVFGLMSALGVFMALFFTLVLLPILLSVWHPGSALERSSAGHSPLRLWQQLPLAGKALLALVALLAVFWFFGTLIGIYVAVVGLITGVVLSWQRSILDSIPKIVARYPRAVLSVFSLILLVCLYGTSLVRIDTNISELTREGSDMRQAYAIVDDNMAGAQSLEIMIDTGVSDGLLNPGLLQAIDHLQGRIEERYPHQVSRTYSLANLVKDTNRIMHNDDPAFELIPDDNAMVSQLLYLFNSANPDDRRALVSDDYSRSHITINAYNAGSYQYQRFFDELAQEIDASFAGQYDSFPDLQVRVTGSIPLMMRATDEIAQSQYSSFLLALGVICVIMMLTLGSVQGGLLSIIPNIIPALLSFGLMGLLDIPLDTDTLMIAPVIIGIAVDDTIHFMTHYRLELIRTRHMAQALQNTIASVGTAVMYTSMVLGLGFAILSFSDYLGMAKIGFFGSLAIFVALFSDLFLIPALLQIFKPRFGVANVDDSFATLSQADTAPQNG